MLGEVILNLIGNPALPHFVCTLDPRVYPQGHAKPEDDEMFRHLTTSVI
jgi:hypothetical protein